MECDLQAVSDYVRQPIETLLSMEFALIPLRFYDVTERSYCPQCLFDDCQSGAVPYWRGRWLDLANTWCHRHQAPLEVATFLPRIVRRTYAAQLQCLQDVSARPPLADDTLPLSWRAVLARQAQHHADAIRRQDPSQRLILVELTERLVGLVLDLCRYDECQEDLAALIGAPYPDRLRLPRPSLRSARQEPDRRDCVRRIRTAYVRSWLLASRPRSLSSSRSRTPRSTGHRCGNGCGDTCLPITPLPSRRRSHLPSGLDSSRRGRNFRPGGHPQAIVAGSNRSEVIDHCELTSTQSHN